jgi:hypothetical protein
MLKAIGSIVTALLIASTTHAGALWDDAFDGASLNANLVQYTAGAGAGSVQARGKLVMDTGGVDGSRQAAVHTAAGPSDAMATSKGKKLYNFYDHPVTVRFDIASISGTPGGRNLFYFSIGDDAEGNHVPQKDVLDNGIGISLEQVVVEGSTYWRIYYSALEGSEAGGGVVANIAGVPTALTYTLEGTRASIELEGATVSKRGRLGSGKIGGTGLTVELADLSANISGYTMAFGAYNFGRVSEKTVVELDSFRVLLSKAVPDSEPSSLGLIL